MKMDDLRVPRKRHNRHVRRMLEKDRLTQEEAAKLWDILALGTGPSTCLGHARSWDRPFHMLGTSPLLGQALQHAWAKPALGTGPSTCLGHARSWDRPVKHAHAMHTYRDDDRFLAQKGQRAAQLFVRQ